MDVSQLDKNRGCLVQLKCFEEMLVKSHLGTSRHNEPLQAVIENKLNYSALQERNNSVLERNRALLQYIATIANSNSKTDEFNYEFVTTLIEGGAEINTADQCEQTIFHEVARSWNVDVARFLLKHGCEINKKDSYGRTPLHVAAAVDHVQMTKFLIENNADMNATTIGDCQAPIHFAAKSGAVKSLKLLLAFHAVIDMPDGKGRTPLQLAAEWTRIDTAKVLIDEGAASSVLDSSGNSALCVLIDRLPNLALEALNQLRVNNVITMTDSYYLQHLEASRQNVETRAIRTPLETAVMTRKFEVVTHPVMQRLIQNKWIQYGRLLTIFDLLFHIVFGIAWTAISIGTPIRGIELYVPVGKNAWRIVLGVFVLLMMAFDISRHIYATKKSQMSRKNWTDWRIGDLEDDLRHCHPRWPQERNLIEYEINRMKSLPLFDAFGAWFYIEWIILALIVVTIVTHFLFYKLDTVVIKNAYTRIISIVNLLVWLRLLKYVRPFPGIGTLVIILGQTVGDFVNWAFLFLLLLIPFSGAFWINFGGISVHPVPEFDFTERLIYSVFQIAVGDNFNLEGIVEADPVMARILVVLYITAVTIVTLNLLIALLSDTFSRVYNNAVANTIMQKAMKVVESERTLTKGYKMKYQEYMNTNCSPEVIKMTFDSKNLAGSPERIEQEMYIKIQNMKKVLDDRFSKVYGLNNISDFDTILSDIKRLKDCEDSLSNDVMAITSMVKKLEENGNNSRSRPSNKLGKPSPRTAPSSEARTTFTSIVARFLSTNETQEKSERSRHDTKKRSKRSERDDQSGSTRQSKSQRQRRRNSEKNAQDDGNAYTAARSNASVVPYNHGNRHSAGATVRDSGQTNPAYERVKEKAPTESDDISL